MNSNHIVARIGCSITALSLLLGSHLAMADKGNGQALQLQTANPIQAEERPGLIRRGLRGIKRRSAAMTGGVNQGFMSAGLTDYSGGAFIRRGKRGIKQIPDSLGWVNALLADSGEYGLFSNRDSTGLLRRGTRN